MEDLNKVLKSTIDYAALSGNLQKMNEQLNEISNKRIEEQEKKYSDKVNRENRMIELLESIDKNTSILNDMLGLLEENTNDQKIILEIVNDLNSLATLPNKEVCQSTYRRIMQKINTAISDVNTINTLCVYGMTIYNTLHAMGKI
ncbi:MAG: hypothetical protein PHN72_02145 [Bacilli bacterium]|nr:hypothetical protein [Bacilli bacterium]